MKYKTGTSKKINSQAKPGIKKQNRTANLSSDVVKVAKGMKKGAKGGKKRR